MDNWNKDPWEYDDKKDGAGQGGSSENGPEQNPDGGNPQAGGPGGDPQNGGPYGNGYRNPQAGGQQYPPPYGQYGNGYGGPYSPRPGGPYYYGPAPQPPHKMGGGLKAFLWVLVAVTVGLVGTFVYFSVRPDSLQRFDSSSSSSQAASSQPSSGFGGTIPKGEESSSSEASSATVIGGVSGDGTDSGFSGLSLQKKPSGAAYTATQVYKKVIGSVVGVETTISGQGGASEIGEGTGIIATGNGYILTNAHVVNYSRENSVKVVMQDKKEYQAKVVGLDKTSDLAVLKINASGLSPATFGRTDEMDIGEQVLAIGNPGGLSFAGSLTGGMISALNRTIESHSDNGMTYIQTDAAINPGNSGGPLVNMYAQVIGINSNKIVASGFEGMGFSIPVSKAEPIINQLIRSGYVSGRTRLGIMAQTVSPEDGFFGAPEGVLIRSIDKDSDMANAGAKVGDIITEADGKKVTSLDDLNNALLGHKPGDVVTMKIYTNGVTGEGTAKTIKVKLLEDKGETQK